MPDPTRTRDAQHGAQSGAQHGTQSGGRHGELRDDPHYRDAQRAMQAGNWANALPLLERLHHQYPGDGTLAALIEECRFKADFERAALPRVRPRQSSLNWRRVAGRGVMALALLLVIALGLVIVRDRVLPLMAETETLEERASLLSAGQRALAAGDLDAAEAHFTDLLALEPQSQPAAEGMAAIARERELAAAYAAADKLLSLNDFEGALKGFNDLQLTAPNYRDVNSRILQVRKLQQLELLYQQAQTQVQLGYSALALATFNEIQSVSTDYRRQEIQDLLFRLNVEQGRALIAQTPPNPAVVPVALDHFDAALRQRPSNAEVAGEQRLAMNYLAGRDASQGGQWPEAVNRLQAVYAEQPNYLAGSVPPILYQAYINNGDLYRAGNDLYKAYDQYRLAAELPISDTVVARGRMAEIQPFLTPTPTPVPTLPPASPVPSATPSPTPTPRPMLAFQGRIVFKSDNEEQPGYWVMDGNGGGREYLGPLEMYDSAVNAYRETERLSPDGQYRVQVGDVDRRAQVLLAKPFDPSFAPRPLTRLSKIAYDPVWAPDGSLIAFVTQQNESDDIWVISPDASVQESLVRNPWEWDKHPSWSPESTRIAFMSNREGTPAVWVMDRSGRNARNISNVPWPEYDPVWVK